MNTNTTSRNLQQIVSTGLVLALAVTVSWMSYAGEPAEAFLFPRLISLTFTIFAAWAFARAALGASRSGAGVSTEAIANLAPGLAVMLLYIFWAAKTLGFYTASTLTVLLILTLYDPASHREGKTWIKRLIVTACFMAVIYCLFTLVLKVQTPRGVLL